MNILITGGTGFIGQRLVENLVSNHQVYLLVREKSFEKAKKQFAKTNNVHFLLGDITQTDVLTNIDDVQSIQDSIEIVIHLAALYDLAATAKECYLQNVIGTQNILRFTGKLKKIKHFHYFSTYAVNQAYTGHFREDQINDSESPFFDQYAKSKNMAEHLVRNLISANYQITIHRPGVVIGDSKTGEFDKIDGPYYFFDFIRNYKELKKIQKVSLLLPLPLKKTSLLPIITIDNLIKWCSEIIENPTKKTLVCYHLISSEKVYTQEFLQRSIEILEVPLKIISAPFIKLYPPIFKMLKMPSEIIYYMFSQATFDRSNLETDFPHFYHSSFQKYLPSLIKAYLKKHERNS